jgi:hypothetical protein
MRNLTTEKNNSLRQLKLVVEAMKDLEQKEVTECMLVVMVALEVGASVDRLVERIGYKREFIMRISLRMRKAKLWIGELVDDREWWEQGSQTMRGIFTHALVGQGSVNRVLNLNGGCTYFDAETGEVSGEWNPPLQEVADQSSQMAT